MNKLKKMLVCLLILLVTVLLQGCNNHPVKSDEDILSDVLTNDDIFSLNDWGIANYYSEYHYSTVEENELYDILYYHIFAFCDDLTYSASYKIVYVLCDNNWELYNFSVLDSAFKSAPHSTAEDSGNTTVIKRTPIMYSAIKNIPPRDNDDLFYGSAVAAIIGDTNYSVGQVSYFYRNTTAYQMTITYSQYGMIAYDLSVPPKDQVQSVDSNTGTVTTYHDYFLQSALDEMVTYTALYNAALANGYSRNDVKDDVAASVNSFKESATSYGYTYKQFLMANYGKYVTPSIYEDMLTLVALANRYYNDYFDGLTYTDEDYQAYYNEHTDELDTFKYSYLYFNPATVETTNAVATAMQNGIAVKELVEEYEPASWGDHNIDVGNSLNTLYSEWLTDCDRQSGDITIIETDTSGVYVVMFHDRYLDQTVSVNVRHILVCAEVDNGATEPTSKQMADARTRAENLLAQWKSGEATEVSFGTLADKASEGGRDSANNLLSPGGLYEKVVPREFVINFDNWLFAEGPRTPGETEIIEVNGDAQYYGYHVVYFVGFNEDDFAWEHDVRSILAIEECSAWLHGLEAQYVPMQADGVKYVCE